MKNLTFYLLSALVLLSVSSLAGCKKSGCTDPFADNYDPDVTEDDGSCSYLSYELSGVVSAPRTLTDRFSDPNKADYLLVGELTVEAALTIEPGVVIQTNAGTQILVNDNGSFSAVGTAAKPIRFVGSSAVAGHWWGIAISSPSSSNRMEYVDVFHAGGNDFYAGALSLDGDGKMAVSNSHFAYSERNGLFLKFKEAELTQYANNQYDHIEGFPVSIHFEHVRAMDNASVFDATTNAQNYIRIESGETTNPFTWRKTNAPYLVTGTWSSPVDAKGDVTIEAGTDIVLDNAAAMAFNGLLTAVGTASAPIQFRGRVATQGFGSTIILYTAGNTLEHCQVSYLGKTGQGGYDAMVYIYDGASLSAANSGFTNSGTWGIYQYGSGQFTDNGNLTFSNNALGNVGP